MKPEHTEHPNTAPSNAHGPAALHDQNAASSSRHTPKAEAATRSNPWGLRVVALVALIGAIGSGLMWSKLSGIQEQLAKQSADTGSQAVEAKAASKQAEELARETAARLAITDAKLGEVALQRSQLEELMQSLSRSRDENLVVDIESALRLAQQQSQLTGSVQPLLAALKSAEQRLTKVANPRLNPVLRAVTRDIEKINATAVSDIPNLLLKLDDLVRDVDTLPLANAVGTVKPEAPKAAVAQSSWARAISMSWWEQWLGDVWQTANQLIRVSRIDRPEASLLAPDQSYFVRENLKLRLLNVRLALLARHFDVARQDLTQANNDLQKYFDTDNRQGQNALASAKEVLAKTKQTELPRLDDTLAALTTAAAGR
jgi:uroporphyrin-III C-methyltransferase